MRKKLGHNCDAKPVLAAKTDFIDDALLLILWNLLKTQEGPKIPAYMARPPFSTAYKVEHSLRTLGLPGSVPIKLLRQREGKTAAIQRSLGPVELPYVRIAELFAQVKLCR